MLIQSLILSLSLMLSLMLSLSQGQSQSQSLTFFEIGHANPGKSAASPWLAKHMDLKTQPLRLTAALTTPTRSSHVAFSKS